MSSQVEICNQALTKLGAARITSLLDPTKQAQALNAIWEVKRDAELTAAPWSFAIRRALLPASSTAPAFGWAYAYPLPADFLRLVQVGDSFVWYDSGNGEQYGGPLFEVEGGAVLSNEASPLSIRYVSRVTNAGLYPALFVEALACRLAAETCEALTQNASKRQAAWQERQQALREALRANAIERPPQQVPPSGWVRSMLEG